MGSRRMIIGKKRILLFIAVLAICIGSVYFYKEYMYYGKEIAEEKNINTNKSEEVEEYKLKEDMKVYNDSNKEENDVEKDIDNILNNMTLEEKVGQLFIVNLEDINDGLDTLYFNDDIKDSLEKYNIGGVIFFQKNIQDRNQVKDLISNIQSSSKIPLFISVDEEGGVVARIGNTPTMNTTKFEDMLEVGNSKNYDRAYEIGNTIGREIHELGFNLDFAPVADVLTNSKNTEIGTRSFGNDPEVVSKMVIKYAEGLQDSNVSATLKHFPGHGDTLENSHEGSSYTLKTLDDVRKVEFLPFKAGIEKGVDFVLVSHLSAPNITGSNVPASLSPRIIKDLLRDELNYKNIVITDALNMGAVSFNYYPGEAAITSLKAGVDILLMTPNFEDVYNQVIEAINENIISEERVDESVERILRVKLNRNILNLD
jgi:beta-N-acetylhexosaminidase